MRDMNEITVQEVVEKMENNEVVNMIDVREVDEVRGGHIDGIVNIPLGLLEFRMNELEKKKEYIIVCRSGGRSGQATTFLHEWGFNVTNMTGGMMAWEEEQNK